jgi:hypothetical protein
MEITDVANPTIAVIQSLSLQAPAFVQSVLLCGWKDTSTKKKLRQRNYYARPHLLSRVIDFGKVTGQIFFWCCGHGAKWRKAFKIAADRQH